MDHDIQKLREELTQHQRTISEKENDIRLLNTYLKEANERVSFQETENTSLRRLVERANAENDQLLQKLDHYEGMRF
jgi:chromosome segregation ATPase